MARPHAPMIAAVLAASAVLGACSSSPTAPDPDRSSEDRIAAIVRVRDEVVGPAQDLGTAAAEVATRLDQLVADPDAATIAATRDAVATLDDARREVEGLDVGDDTADVTAAASALGDAADGAVALGEAAGTVAAAAEDAAAVDGALGGLVASWDEPGSRSQLLERFDEVAATADGLAATPETSGCPGPVQQRQAWATFVADATRELRDLVARYDGTTFDARRAELAEAPYGVDDDGVARGPGVPIDPVTCPRVERAEAAASSVVDALRALQQALNPTDLSS